MTKIAVLSDIHANIIALNAVLRDAQPRCDAYWILGDVIGYGINPVAVLDELVQLNIDDNCWLVGNHDSGLVELEYRGKGLPLLRFRDDARRVIIMHHKVMKSLEAEKKYIEHLARLRFTGRPRDNVFLAHGAYYPDEIRLSMLERYTTNVTYIEEDFQANLIDWQAAWRWSMAHSVPLIVIYGHNHIPAFWMRHAKDDPNRDAARDFWMTNPVVAGQRCKLEPGQFYHLNPGGAGGFTRSNNFPCAWYLLLEESDGAYFVEFRKVPFDVERTREQMKQVGIPPTIYGTVLNC